VTLSTSLPTTFVVGDSTFAIGVEPGASAREVNVTVTANGRFTWTVRQPAWRPMSFGCGEGTGYLWSARSLLVLPQNAAQDPLVIDIDEDLVFAFKLPARWVLVCETSVRLHTEDGEATRLELGEVVEQARWEDGVLVLFDPDGRPTRVTVGEGITVTPDTH